MTDAEQHDLTLLADWREKRAAALAEGLGVIEGGRRLVEYQVADARLAREGRPKAPPWLRQAAREIEREEALRQAAARGGFVRSLLDRIETLEEERADMIRRGAARVDEYQAGAAAALGVRVARLEELEEENRRLRAVVAAAQQGDGGRVP